MTPNKETLDRFILFVSSASDDSLLASLEAIARQSGIEQIDGVPIRQFFFRERERHIEQSIASFAETDMVSASELKRVFEDWKHGRGVFS